VQGIVYTTRSLIEAENETVVSNAIEYISSSQQSKMPFRVTPPVVPLSESQIDSENPLVGKYLRYMPNNIMSGCFVAVITREASD
jgi:16S rRNA C967 or C1407 C5-methylase (RsmB/RsmF family)